MLTGRDAWSLSKHSRVRVFKHETYVAVVNFAVAVVNFAAMLDVVNDVVMLLLVVRLLLLVTLPLRLQLLFFSSPSSSISLCFNSMVLTLII